MSKPDQPRSKWRWLKRGLFAVVALITLLAVVVVVENMRGRSAWAAYKAKLEAAGEPMDFGQLVPTDVADEQNFARTPLLAPLTDYELDATGQPVFADPEAKRRLDALFAWVQPLEGMGQWREVEATEWTRAQASLRSQTNSPLPEFQALLAREPGTPAEDVRFLFSLNQKELDEITAAVRRPYANFQTRFDKVEPGLLPHLMTIRVLARGFALKPRAELAAGNAAQALADWKTCVALGDTLDGDPVLIGLLVKIAVVDSSLNAVWEGLQHRSWNEAQLAEMQRTLESINLVDDAKRTFQGERIYGLTGLDQLLLAKAGPHQGSAFLRGFLLPGWVAQNKVSLCRLYDEAIFPLLDPEHAAINVAEVDAVDQRVRAEFQRNHPYRMMARMLFPAISKSVLKIAHAQMGIHLATIGCALERYRLAEGRYPENLGALRSRFLKTLPDDVDGQPLRYRREPNGSFLLYSVGMDLKDDQGQPTPNAEGDWVWKYPDPPVSFE